MPANSMHNPVGMQLYGARDMSGMHYTPQLAGQNRISPPPSDHEELIPTAIVIKNIPFAVKKEQLTAKEIISLSSLRLLNWTFETTQKKNKDPLDP